MLGERSLFPALSLTNCELHLSSLLVWFHSLQLIRAYYLWTITVLGSFPLQVAAFGLNSGYFLQSFQDSWITFKSRALPITCGLHTTQKLLSFRRSFFSTSCCLWFKASICLLSFKAINPPSNWLWHLIKPSLTIVFQVDWQKPLVLNSSCSLSCIISTYPSLHQQSMSMKFISLQTVSYLSSAF